MPDPIVDPKPDDQNEAPKAGEGETPKPSEVEAFKSEESKQAVLADLMKEREERKALDAKLAEYEKKAAEAEKAKLSDIERSQAETAEALKVAEEATAKLAVYETAARHGITDADDLALLGEAKSAEAMEKLAARIATPAGPQTPKPDPSVGNNSNAAPATLSEQIAAAEKAGDHEAAKRLKASQLGSLANN